MVYTGRMNCPRCTGHLYFEIGFLAYGEHMTRVRSEDRIVCLMCSRYRYLTEQANSTSARRRGDALPIEVLQLAEKETVRKSRAANKRGK